MSDPLFADLSDEQLQNVHRACEAFERALSDGPAVSIEASIRNALHTDRSVLFRELLAIELQWRLSRGEQPIVAEYQARFPGEQDVVGSALHSPTPAAC